MAQLHFDGFDMGILPDYTGTAAVATSSSTAFSYGLCASLTGNGVYWAKSFAAAADVYLGVRYTATQNSNAAVLAVFGDGNSVEHLRVWWSTPSTLNVGRGATSLATASVPEPTTGTWTHVELRALIADSGGRAVVRIDGTTVIDFTGDTRNGGVAASVDALRFYGGNGFARFYDDLYINDASGAAPHNTFYGPCRVYTLAPTGPGTDTAFTSSSGANWTAVDEQPYSASDYVSSSTVGARDTYTMADLPGTVTTVYGVRQTAVAKSSDGAAVSLKTATRSGGSLYTGTAVPLGATDGVAAAIRSVDPATGAAWTVSGVNAVEAGFEVA